MTTTDAEIVQATRHRHDQIRDAVGRQAQDILDDPTPFDPGHHVFHHHPRTGEEVIEEVIPHVQGLACGLFLGGGVKTPAGS